MSKKIGTLFLGSFAGLFLLQFAVGCSSPSNGAGVERLTAEQSSIEKGQKATEAAATNSNGLTNGSGLTVLAMPSLERSGFTAETDCAVSGWPATGSSGDVGYAMKFLLCSVLKRPDGPDTVRGGFDRISGFLCAIGNITYDSTPKSVPITISTNCFSQTFVTTACTFFSGSASTGPCSSTATVGGYLNNAGVAPAQYEKYVTISLSGGSITYTIAHTTTATTISAACMDNLPTGDDSNTESTFAFHLNSTTGKLRYEGRFPGNNKRHMRINLSGTISTDFAVTNVDGLSFVQGENFTTSGAGLIVSVNGTPAAGRRIRIRTTSDMASPIPTWGLANADDNICIGEVSATCVANSGIIEAGANPKKFFFDTGSGHTGSKTWFTNHSYLGGVSDTVDMDDIWD